MEQTPEGKELSLVEQKRIEAFKEVIEELNERLPVEVGETFVSNEREYKITSAEDCMVCFAQQNREAVAALYADIMKADDYRKEQAVVKLLKLFEAYEKTVALYAELRSYYPVAARAVEEKLPPLNEIAQHGSSVWQQIKEVKDK